MTKPKGRLRKLLFFTLGLVGWLVGIVLVLWLTLPRWLPSVIAHFTAPMEIEMEIREVGLQHSSVEDIEAKIDPIRLSIPNLSVSYTPGKLVSGRVQTIMLSRASLDLNLATQAVPGGGEATEAATPPDLRSIFNTPLPELPLDELLIDGFMINFIPESDDRISSTLDLQATRSGQQWDARADLRLYDSQWNLAAHQSDGMEKERRLELTFELPDPMDLVRKSIPLLPEETQQMLRELPVEVGGSSGTLDWNTVDDSINLQTLLEHLKYAELAEADTVFLNATSSDYLETAKATLFVQNLSLTNIASAHLETDFEAKGPMSGQPAIAADLTISNLILSDALPVAMESDSESMPELGSHLSFTPMEEPIRGVESSTTLSIPSSTVTIHPTPEIIIRSHIIGQVRLGQKAERAELVASIHLSDFHYQDNAGFKLNGELTSDLEVQVPNLPALTSFDPFRNFESVNLTGGVKIDGQWMNTGFAAVVSDLGLEQVDMDSGNGFTGHLKVDTANWDIWELQQAELAASVLPDSAEMMLEGQLLNPSLIGSVSYQTNFATATQHGEIRVFTSPETDRSRLKLQRLDATMPETIAEGIVKASVSIAGTYENPMLGLLLNLEDGSLEIPGNKTTIRGIRMSDFIIDNLLTGHGPTEQVITIGSIDFPPNRISDIRLVIDPLEGFGVNIRKLTFRFCGGFFEIDFSEPILPPYDTFKADLKFTNLDLSQLTKLIPDFEDEIEGKIEGHIPVVFKEGKISWEEGQVNLMEGTTCLMRYSKTGLVATYIPKIEINSKLDIDVNEALRDMTITKLNLKLRSSDQFTEPSVVVISGHSNNFDPEIPFGKIQLNIRAGDAPAVINGTIRRSEWLQWLSIKGKMNKQRSTSVK